MARHGIFIGNQKITARYIGDRLVWQLKTGASGHVVWGGEAIEVTYFARVNQMAISFLAEPPILNKEYRYLNINGAIFEIASKYVYSTSILYTLEKSSSENREIAEKGNPTTLSANTVSWRNVTIKFYDTLDAQPGKPDPQPQPRPDPEKPAVGALAFEGTIHRIMAFKNNNFLDFYFYHDNQIANQAYKNVEINGVVFPIKNIRSYGTSVIGINGEGNFTSKKDDLTKAGLPLNDNYRQVNNPKIKLYK